ncbi:type IX secretion system outer membrane channel protein PorV [Chryseolinea sp. H1M3-3]|uniref:type IX secretion system outer membrane channel protein PorV n=1 Tax=Chryseolinea sp. H1M3-3 TaxID=3034144 RepID=UPI0023EBAC9B|nr:type IX secretion system outer membrane channel protein PorV [Chryseolinea sp. H1M3-3]
MKNTLMYYRVILLLILGGAATQQAFSQNVLGQEVAITTAVPFLAISPDARHAALGDAGVATSPDANSAYWNAGKLVFIQNKYGASASYTPWLGKIVNDMSISYLTGFYKITREQAVSIALKYFDMGDITFREGPLISDISGEYNPRDFSFDATYSRMLSENLGIGLSGRYIYSNLTGTSATIDAKPGKSVAADVGIYYTKPLQWRRLSTLSLGASISNIGAKLTYTDNNNEDFLPTNFRVGTALTTELDPYNTITFVLDFNKLMVPSPPIRNDTSGVIISGRDPNRSLLNAMFSSFTDAPNGASEEFQEVMTSVGIEYWYNKTFAARLGYFNEARSKGNRKYMTIGLGFNKDRFGIDIAYLVPTAKREHPLAETLRFTLHFNINENPAAEESVTDNP